MRGKHWVAVGLILVLGLGAFLWPTEPSSDHDLADTDDMAVREPNTLLRDEPVLEGGAKPAPKPVPDEEPSADAPEPPAKQVVRDAYDGSVVSGVQIGRLDTDGKRGRPRVFYFAEPSDEWMALGKGEDGTYWVCRRMRLSLRVLASGGTFDITKVKPSFRPLDTRAWSARRPQGLPKDWRRRINYAFHRGQATQTAVPYVAEIPRVRGLLVSAKAEGFLSAWTQVDDIADPTHEVRVDLTLRSGPVISGKVLDEVGKPVPRGTKLLVRVSVPYPDDETDSTGLMVGVGWDAIGAGGKDDAHIRFEKEIEPDGAGAFDLHLPVEGQLLLRATRTGYESVKTRFGMVNRDRSGLDITMAKLRGKYRTHTLLAHDGKLLRKGLPIALWKKEGTAITDIINVEVGTSGMIPTAKLERGMQYYVKDLTRGKPMDWGFLGKFTWEEQQTVVLAPAH